MFFLVTTTFADIAVWSVTRENSLFQLMTAVCGGKYRGFRRPVCQGCWRFSVNENRRSGLNACLIC